uniref:Plasmalemma vesicle associated protein b n=1 Tax=Fundulus heteroclitus TaxID=8078 RepID=A0A3Q2Q1V8_FUNHE
MYSSSYSRAKLGPESRQPLYRNRGKSCGYYMRIIFFFSSLIQSLIIISLVLFLIYGQPEKSAEEKRLKELEQGYNDLSKNHMDLRKEKAELTAQLAARVAEKAALEKEMAKQQTKANNTEQELRQRIAAQDRMINMRRQPFPPVQAPPPVTINYEAEHLRKTLIQQNNLIKLINANFSQMVEDLTHERDLAQRNKNDYLQEALKLRRDNSILTDQLAAYTRKCKEDFVQSLNGIQTVTSTFLDRINNLFPHSLTFHLTCNSQQEQLEKIKSSCSNLSRDVESKFQLYLDNVGNKVVEIQALSSQLQVSNSYLSASLEQCEQKHSEALAKAAKDLEERQKAHDNQVERLLTEQKCQTRAPNGKEIQAPRVG